MSNSVSTASHTLSRDEVAAILESVDAGYRAALHILKSARFRNDARVWRHVFPVGLDRGIDFDGMIAEGTFSHGEELLLQCAHSLFNGRTSVALDEIACCLDAEALELVLKAIQIRATS